MKKLLLIFVILVSFAYAQTPVLNWEKDIPKDSNGLHVRYDYDMEMVDTKTMQHIFMSDSLIVFAEINGDIKWFKNFGGGSYQISDELNDYMSHIVDSKDGNNFMFVAGDTLYQIGYSGEIIKQIKIPITMTPSDLNLYSGGTDAECYYVVQSNNQYGVNTVFAYNQLLELTRTFNVVGQVKKIVTRENNIYVLTTRGPNSYPALTKLDMNNNILWEKYFTERTAIMNISAAGNLILTFERTLIRLYNSDGGQIFEKTIPDHEYTYEGRKYLEIPVISDIQPLAVNKFVVLGHLNIGIWSEFQGWNLLCTGRMATAYSESGDSLWTIRDSNAFYPSNIFYKGYLSSRIHGDSFYIFGRNNGPYHLWKYSLGVTGLDNEKIVPQIFFLSQNYPNPFNPTTRIDYYIPNAGMVVLKVYDLLGDEIATLVNERKGAGNYSVNFDASKLASGVYIYRLIAGNKISAKKMILIK